MSVRVLKFGGTSLDSAGAMRAALQRIAAARRESAVVVVASALAGTTDRLVRALAEATARDPAGRDAVAELAARHRAQMEELAPQADADAVLGPPLERLRELLGAVHLLAACPPPTHDETLAQGERLAVRLLAAALTAAGLVAESVDATELLRTDSRFGDAGLDWPVTARQVEARLGGRMPGSIALVPGFFGADAEGRITLLGRGASDWSATILGAALAAERVEIWTDVDGVLSADPRLVPEARLLPTLAYGAAAEMAAFGAKVLHPNAVAPAARAGVPVWIRNTLHPEGPGTWIGEAPEPCGGGVATCPVVLIEVAGGAGPAARALAGCERLGLEVLALQQGSARGELALVVAGPPGATLLRALASAIPGELRVQGDLAVVAAIGDPEAPAAALRQALAASGIRPRLLLERPGGRSAAAVVAAAERGAAAIALHARLPSRRATPVPRAAAG